MTGANPATELFLPANTAAAAALQRQMAAAATALQFPHLFSAPVQAAAQQTAKQYSQQLQLLAQMQQQQQVFNLFIRIFSMVFIRIKSVSILKDEEIRLFFGFI